MALPDNSLSSTAILADFTTPYDRYSGPLEDFEAGGIALQDGSQGLDVQIWYLSYDDLEDSPTYGDFRVTAETTGDSSVVTNVAGVTRVGLAFNQNMDVFIAYETKACEAKYYWYDTTIPGYTTSTLAAGSQYVACCLDDHRETQTGTSDIILAYMRSGTLYYRHQRDRFGTERTLKTGLGSARLWKVGMSKNGRLKFDISAGGQVRLSEIVGDLCRFVELPANQLDVDDLYETVVRGFISAGIYTAADTIRELQKVYFFDMPEADGKLVAVPRGGDVVVTINQSDCVTGREVDFETAREQGYEFPVKTHLMYASAESDYAPVKQTSERRSIDVKANAELSTETAVNFVEDDAAQAIDKIHKIAWTEFEGKATFGIAESFARYIPSDLISLEVRPDTFRRMRLVRMTWQDGYFECEAVMDRASSYTSTVVGVDPTDGETQPSSLVGSTTWEFMDLPCLGSEDTLHYYVAAHGDAGSAWYGAQLQRLTGSEFEPEAEIMYAENMGQVEENTGSGSRYVPDNSNTLLVSLTQTPSSITDDQLYTWAGMWLIGNEIVQVRDWVAEGDNWRGSYLLRGRFDTTPATHAIGARVVFLDSPISVVCDVGLLDTTLTLRAPSYGQPSVAAVQDDYSFTGASQEEWAPINLTATTSSPVGDWSLSWEPRYRLGNSANPIPSVNFYAWRLRFTVGATTVTKTTSSTAASYTYTSADQVTDFGSAQASFDTIEIRAMNYLGGEGKALTV